MTTVEVILILIGVVFIIGSFIVKDKLTKKDIDKIADMSQDELKIIVDKQLKNAKATIEDSIDESIEESKDKTIRAMEKESNEKIMSISEYSDTVLESMNKTHNEIMFLYSMLNDKHKELTDFASKLQNLSDEISSTELEKEIEDIEVPESINENDAFVSYVASQKNSSSDSVNNNNSILELHRLGKTDIEIAKELGLGLGEVKLVIGLYKEESADEI